MEGWRKMMLLMVLSAEGDEGLGTDAGLAVGEWERLGEDKDEAEDRVDVLLLTGG